MKISRLFLGLTTFLIITFGLVACGESEAASVATITTKVEATTATTSTSTPIPTDTPIPTTLATSTPTPTVTPTSTPTPTPVSLSFSESVTGKWVIAWEDDESLSGTCLTIDGNGDFCLKLAEDCEYPIWQTNGTFELTEDGDHYVYKERGDYLYKLYYIKENDAIYVKYYYEPEMHYYFDFYYIRENAVLPTFVECITQEELLFKNIIGYWNDGSSGYFFNEDGIYRVYGTFEDGNYYDFADIGEISIVDSDSNDVFQSTIGYGNYNAGKKSVCKIITTYTVKGDELTVSKVLEYYEEVNNELNLINEDSTECIYHRDSNR